MDTYDVIVIGGGIAGVSLGYELATEHKVLLVEAEGTLAFHTTGRSAATFLESYGGPVIRALTTSSRAFLQNPPDTFESQLMTPLPVLWLGPEGRSDSVRDLHAAVSQLVPTAHLIDGPAAEEMHPYLMPGYTELAMVEPDASELDVHAIHQGYTRGFRERGGVVTTHARIVAAERRGSAWQVRTVDGTEYAADTVVNAAGAWCDAVGEYFGAPTLGIQPLLRTIFTIGAPNPARTRGLPLVGDIDVTFYVKPEGPQFLCSPADEILQEPGDARPNELEVARALDAINTATTLQAKHVKSSWGGLRNFVPDRVPVVGYDSVAPNFFWFAGQGGYGIQTAPALAVAGAAILTGAPLPSELAAKGIGASDLAVDRPGLSVAAEH